MKTAREPFNRWHFYPPAQPDEARLVCSWDTRAEDNDAFVADILAIVGPKKATREIQKKGKAI